MDYKSKYLKYKKKYIKISGGSTPTKRFYITNPDGSIIYLSEYQQRLYLERLAQQKLEQDRARYIEEKRNNTKPRLSLLKEEKEEEEEEEVISSDKIVKLEKKCEKELMVQKEKFKQELIVTNKQHQINIRQKSMELERQRNQYNECKEKLKHLLELAASNSWDMREDKVIESYSRKHNSVPDVRMLFYPLSGPFIYQRTLNKLEDEMTEYKHHEKIYSNYDRETNGLDYELDVGCALSVKAILEKNIVAFLNSSGGRLFFGISDKLMVYGIPNVNTLEHADHIQIKMTNDICINIKTYNISTKKISTLDTTNFILFIWHNVFDADEERYVLEIQVLKGSNEYVYITPDNNIYFRGPGTTITNRLEDAIAKIEQRRGRIFDKDEVLVELPRNLTIPRKVVDGTDITTMEEGAS